MELLVLGGSVFVSAEVARLALHRGHRVTCANRGISGTVPDGAEQVVWDRGTDVPPTLARRQFDAVVDVSRTPSHVRRAVATWPDAHWTFVSTGSVYADDSVAGMDATAATVRAEHRDLDPRSTPQAYGAMKVACEQLVAKGVRAAFIVRPGLIVGPGDPTGRFSYWPAHAAAAAEDHQPLLAPGDPTDQVQFIDVADLASWILDSAESGRAGVWDAVIPPITRAELHAALSGALGTQLEVRYVLEQRLHEAGVVEWMGPDAIPLWIAGPDSAGFMARDVSGSLDQGLRPSAVHDTIIRTLAWLEGQSAAPVTGISRARELDLIASLG